MSGKQGSILEKLVSTSNYDLGYIYYPRNYFGLSFLSYTKQNVSQNYELDGSLTNTSIMRQELDYYGNVTLIVIDYGEGKKDSTLNYYHNDTLNWILGRLIRAEVYKISPGKPTQIRTSSFEYDPVTGQLLKETAYPDLEPNQQLIKTYQYDGFGNIVKSDTKAWNDSNYETRSTCTQYDPSGKFIIKLTNSLGHESGYKYDKYTGKQLESTDPNGRKTVFEYDDVGRLKKETSADGNWVYYDYKIHNINISDAFKSDYVWSIIKQSSLSGKQIEFYDGLDRQIGIEKVGFSGKIVLMEKEYGANNMLARESRWHYFDEPPQYSQYVYDSYGRIIKEIQPGDRIDSIKYEVNKKTVINSQKQRKVFIQDVKERTIQVLDNQNNALNYDYDAGGNLLSITDPKGNKILNEYNLKDQKVIMTDPDLGMYKYEYNGFGELIKQIDPKGFVTIFEYDKLGRLIKRTQEEGATLWKYDIVNHGIGLLSDIISYDGSLETYLYDTLSRIIETKKTINGRIFSSKVSYDSKGRIDTLSYPSGFKIRNIYNVNSYLSEIRKVGDNLLYWKASKVNALGMLETQQQANNVLTEYFYNSQTLYLDSLSGSNNSTIFNRWRFNYSSLGNILQRTNVSINKTETFNYDNLNRLTNSSVLGGKSISLDYDEVGNIVSKSDVGTYEYSGVNNGPHRLTKINLFGPKCIPSFQIISEYTSFNKVRKLSKDSLSLIINYGHDLQRNFAATYSGNALIKSKYYFNNLYEIEIQGDSIKETNYIRGSGGVIATFVVQNRIGKSFFWFKDHLGSLTKLTDSLGNVLEEYSYDAWGRRRNTDWSEIPDSLLFSFSSNSVRGFSGHEHYDLFSLIDMNGRIYDPVIGRFNSPDPFIPDVTELQSFNHYSYVYNNPLSLTDPSGYWPGFINNIVHAIGSVANAVIDLHIKAFNEGTKWVKENWKTIVIVTVVVAATIATGGVGAAIGSAFWGTVLSGAAAGFAGAFTGTLINGGTFSDALKSGGKGAVIGAASAGLTYGAGELATSASGANNSVTAGQLGIKVAGNGIVQGGVSEANGGKFVHGFVSGAISQGANSLTGNVNSETLKLATNSAVGGTTSAISGDKFANGAITSAYANMLVGFTTSSNGGQESRREDVLADFDPMKNGVVVAENGNEGYKELARRQYIAFKKVSTGINISLVGAGVVVLSIVALAAPVSILVPLIGAAVGTYTIVIGQQVFNTGQRELLTIPEEFDRHY